MKFFSRASFVVIAVLTVVDDYYSAELCPNERIDYVGESKPLHTFPDLYEAIERHNKALAICLIINCVNVDEAGYNDWTPLSRAAQFGMLDVVKVLLAAGANPLKADTFQRVPFEYANEFYEKYSGGDYASGYLGPDPDSRISDYLSIVRLLSNYRNALPEPASYGEGAI